MISELSISNFYSGAHEKRFLNCVVVVLLFPFWETWRLFNISIANEFNLQFYGCETYSLLCNVLTSRMRKVFHSRWFSVYSFRTPPLPFFFFFFLKALLEPFVQGHHRMQAKSLHLILVFSNLLGVKPFASARENKDRGCVLLLRTMLRFISTTLSELK